MNSAPACAGQSTQTFLLKVGKRVFLCLKAGTKPLAYSSQSSSISQRQQLIVGSSFLSEHILWGGPVGQARPLPRGARRPPRGCRAGTPELTTPMWSTTTGTGIPGGFQPGKARKGRSEGAEARVPLDQEFRLKTNS